MNSYIEGNKHIIGVIIIGGIGFLSYLLWRYMDILVIDKKGRPLPVPRPFLDLNAMRTSRSLSRSMHNLIVTQNKWNIFGINVWHVGKLCFLSHPEYAKVILSGHYSKFPKSIKYRRLNFFLGQYGLVTSNGHVWQHHRHLINQAFHAEALRNMISGFSQHTMDYMAALRARMATSSSGIRSIRTDINKDIVNLTLSIISQAAFGFRIKDRDDGDDVFHHFCCISDEVIERLNDPTDWWHHIQPSRTRPADRAIQALNKILHEVITDRQHQREASTHIKQSSSTTTDHDHTSNNQPHISSSSGPKDLVDVLLDAADIHDDHHHDDNQHDKKKVAKSLSYDQIRDHAMTFFLAGFDTTSSALSWILYELCLHPDIMVKCQAEIDTIYEDHHLSLDDMIPYEAIAEAEYLSAVIKESLRLHPPASSLGRGSTDDVILPSLSSYHHKNGDGDDKGYMMPAGTIFVTLVSSLHRHPDFWTEPDTFNPTRFLKENIRATLKHPFQYLPFSGGPRNCIGQRFAMMEMTILLTMLLKNFSFSVADDDISLMRVEEVLIQQPRNLHLTITDRIISTSSSS